MNQIDEIFVTHRLELRQVCVSGVKIRQNHMVVAAHDGGSALGTTISPFGITS